MKKIIQIMALAITGFTATAQPVKEKMKPLDKNAALQTTNRKLVFTEVPSVNSSVYSPAPRKVITLSDGKKITIDMVRNPTTGGNAAIQKIITATLPTERKDGWTTEVRKTYLTAESTTFQSASNSNTVNIVPGAIYSFSDFLGGSNNEILGNRTPIRIYTSNALKPGATGGIVVTNPSGYDILQGNNGNNLNVIKNSIAESNAGVDFISRSFTSNSEAELDLKVTGGGSYSGFTGSGGYRLSQRNNRFYLTIDAVKPMFTIKAERPQNGFFTSSNSVADKVYVKEVTYGTRVLANLEIVLTKRDDILNFQSSYSGAFKADLATDFIKKDSLRTETVNAYLIGVPSGSGTSFHKNNLEEEIRALMALCTFQNAKPISYSLGDMEGNTIATRSATDEIIEANSVPDNLVYRLQEAFLEIQTGDDNKESQSRVAMELYSGNADDGKILMYQPIDNSKIDFPRNNPMTFGLTINQGTNPNDLLLDNIKTAGGLRVRIYYYANWSTDAWKIEGVSLKLKFIDQNGIAFPTSKTTIQLDGSRPFICTNATAVLDGFDRKVIECYFNSSFSSIGIAIKK